MNLNHKNDVDIVVPSVPTVHSEELEVDNVNSEEERDKATNAFDKMHPIAPGCSGSSWNDMPELWEPIKIRQSRQDHPPIRTTDSLPSIVLSESRETDATPATTMKRTQSSIAPITQTTSTGTKHQDLCKKMHPKMKKHKMVTILKRVGEDHMNLNHKNDVDIVVPSVPTVHSEELEVDNVKSEEEVDKATNASEKIPKVLRVTKKKEEMLFLKVVSESGETEVTPATKMKRTESSMAPNFQTTSTGTKYQDLCQTMYPQMKKHKNVTVLQKVGADHMNLNHKNDEDIVVPSVPTVHSEEPEVDNVKSEEEVDKATNALEKMHPIAPGWYSRFSCNVATDLWEPIKLCQDHPHIRTTDALPSMVLSESGETEEATPVTTMNKTEGSIAPIIQTTGTDTKDQHLCKKMHPKIEKHKTVTVLETLDENHMNLYNKNDVDIVVSSVPTVLSEEPEVDNVNGEEEVDKATNALEKIPKVLRVTKKKEEMLFQTVVSESGETEVTPATTMKRTEFSIAPTFQTTSTDTGSSTMTPPVVLGLDRGHPSHYLSIPISITNSISFEDTVGDVSAQQETLEDVYTLDATTTMDGDVSAQQETLEDVYTLDATTTVDGSVTWSGSGSDSHNSLVSDILNSYLPGCVPGEHPIVSGLPWNDMTDLWESIKFRPSSQYHPPIRTADSFDSVSTMSVTVSDPFYSHKTILQLPTYPARIAAVPTTFPSHIETPTKFSSFCETSIDSSFPSQFDRQTIGTDCLTRAEI
eukprot:scaffold52701_cov55-Attheya_sp.AAC.2